MLSVLISKAWYIFRGRNIHQDKNDKNHPGLNFAKYILLTLFICKSYNYHDIYNLSITSVHNIPNYSSFSGIGVQHSEFCEMEISQKSKSFLQWEPVFQWRRRLMKAHFDRISYYVRNSVWDLITKVSTFPLINHQLYY